MGTVGETRFFKTKRKDIDLAPLLRKSWYHLRLSVAHPSRVPTWDAILLTAASPQQALLYQWQLDRAKRLGRIAPSTLTLAVPDPDGHRIGSGAATLHAIYALAQHLGKVDPHRRPKGLNAKKGDVGSPSLHESSNSEFSALQIADTVAKMHILLLHAGGDSKRVPWANPMGKVFLPLPYLATDDPDGPVPLLFDHILAVASCARRAFKDEGGIFMMTGDVLPFFDASTIILPDDTSCIITVPITLDVASNHGVIVASDNGTQAGHYNVCLVDNLLQKPTIEDLVTNNAVRGDGTALLDTGVIAVRGKGWIELVTLACSCQHMISELLRSGKEMSLYEDLVAAWVPAKHEWLLQRPLGQELVSRLGKQKMFSCCAYELLFLHFGTSSEVLDHLGGMGLGLVGRRHLCSIPSNTDSDIAESAVILSSKLEPGISVGDESLIYDSFVSGGVRIGSQSIMVGVNLLDRASRTPEDPCWFILPDRHCLWEVPLTGHLDSVLVCCGLYDNPKLPVSKRGTFCGRPWKNVLHDLGIQESNLWTSPYAEDQCLWNAKIYPILPYLDMIRMMMWLIGLSNQRCEYLLLLWKSSVRVSLEEMHRSIDFSKMCTAFVDHQAKLASGIIRASISYGMLGHNLSQLCEEILQKGDAGVNICENLLTWCKLQEPNSSVLPKSRTYQMQVDLLRACKKEAAACELEHKVWTAVADETALAVKYGFTGNSVDLTTISSPRSNINNFNNGLDRYFKFRKVKVELPVRVDFVGGWSDTPPWSLERAGCVLNMAICLECSLPIGTIIETTEKTGVLITDDFGNQLHIEELSSIASPFDVNDPFRLVKSALIVTGIVQEDILTFMGLRIETWANVPRGSGLGTSSILAAAVVKALVQITDGDDSNENVARLVLVVEQLMGTGGGWQDQIGGLYPGIKFTTSFPGLPLRLQPIPLLPSPQLILELHQRLLVVFTGQVRLAHQVLQKVVGRYLRRDHRLIYSIKRLVELAKIGREAMMNCDVNELGEIMMEAWRLHQELDPYCSNAFVDKLFAFSDPFCCGYKLVGAGGGGFALLLAKSAEFAQELRQKLEEDPIFDVKIYEWNIFFQK